MIDLIVFNAGNNYYALDIENIQRIIQAKELTTIPSAHKFIDGMMSYENKVIKVLNFRKLINLPTYEEELMKNQNSLHVFGVSALELSKKNNDEAQKILQTVANSLQKLILYKKNTIYFAIKVDSIADIVHVEESKIINTDEENSIGEFLELNGVLDRDGVLINIIKTLNIPK